MTHMCTNLRRAHLMLLQRELLALRATQFLRLPLQRRISHGISSLMGPNPSNIKPHTSGDDRSHLNRVSTHRAKFLCSRVVPSPPWGHADGNVNPTLAHTRERERERTTTRAIRCWSWPPLPPPIIHAKPLCVLSLAAPPLRNSCAAPPSECRHASMESELAQEEGALLLVFGGRQLPGLHPPLQLQKGAARG